jgi:TolB-like protein
LKTRLSEAGIRVKDGTPRVLTATWTWTGAAGVKGFSGTVQAGRGKIVFRIEDDEKEVGSALCEGMGSGQGDEPAQRAIAACDLSSLVNQLGSLGPVGQKPRRKVGVVVIDNEDGPSEWVGAGESIARMLETELVRGGKVELLERKKMVNITRETVLAAAGMTKSLTDDFQADGADAVVLGSVVWTGDGLETELRLVEIPSGKVVAATSALIPDRPSMRPEVVRMAKELGKTR